MKVDYIAL